MSKLENITFDRIFRSNKLTLLKLVIEAKINDTGAKLQDEENLLETSITSKLYDTASDNYEMVKYLILNGAQVNNRALVMSIRAYDQSDLDTNEKVGKEQESPSLALVMLLIDGIPEEKITGADLTEIDDMGENILMKTVGTTFYDNDEKRNEQTILKIVKKLVENGAEINVENCIGETVLDIARQRAPQSVVDYLQSQMMDISKDISCVLCENKSKKICSKCKSVRYCSQHCQAKHWQKHQKCCSKN